MAKSLTWTEQAKRQRGRRPDAVPSGTLGIVAENGKDGLHTYVPYAKTSDAGTRGLRQVVLRSLAGSGVFAATSDGPVTGHRVIQDIVPRTKQQQSIGKGWTLSSYGDRVGTFSKQGPSQFRQGTDKSQCRVKPANIPGIVWWSKERRKTEVGEGDGVGVLKVETWNAQERMPSPGSDTTVAHHTARLGLALVRFQLHSTL
ncbi:hypothetical protein B0H66DRAFT_536814 [Apodospora peruviana]|uniref:Uncharacterized protein n=1 Tax=Apodospora peruviana TaxID=516989 RepID=A0AAE0HV91_9PEZI|nr:hypothetical protein B0H66DRAFT_536814 [Apodospora peruviana]